jgi:SAM-dependent methyltransferase
MRLTMRRTVARIIRKTLNPILGIVHAEITSTKRKREYEEYLSMQETLAGAKAAGLSVGEYIDQLRTPGATRRTFEQIKKLGVFQERIDRVCEIGPGSGRYLEKVLHECRPSHYEIYETAHDWADWLVEKYKVVRQHCDRVSLSATATQTIDLAHSHKLFPGVPFLMICNYLMEMARVVRPGGWVIFDVFTENCMDEQNLAAWLAVKPWDWDLKPAVVPREFLIDFLGRQKLVLTGSFLIPLWPGHTEVFVFRKLS